MQKRKIILGTYDTAAQGWTLTGWKLSAAAQKTNYVAKSGGDGSHDLSTAMTDGLMRYNDRTLTATLECSDGDRQSRETKIRHLINALDGMRVDIVLPDDALHHLNGRLHIVREYNDLAHAAVSVTATCKPWKYANIETVIALTAKTAAQTVTLSNAGRLAVVPVIKVEGSGASVLLAYTSSRGTVSKAFSAGTYQWPELLLTPGVHDLTYSGTGTALITYREAVLE